jgi:hypothetical protein
VQQRVHERLPVVRVPTFEFICKTEDLKHNSLTFLHHQNNHLYVISFDFCNFLFRGGDFLSLTIFSDNLANLPLESPVLNSKGVFMTILL